MSDIIDEPNLDNEVSISHLYFFLAEKLVQNDVDILKEHRTHNRPVCPPQPKTLANAAAQQNGHQIRQTGFQDNLSKTVGEGDAADATDKDEDKSSVQWAHRYSKTPSNNEPKATTMKYYPSCWQAMLEMAKNDMRKHIALVNPFPQRDKDLKEATLILNNTLAEYQGIENNTLQPGYFIYLLSKFISY